MADLENYLYSIVYALSSDFPNYCNTSLHELKGTSEPKEKALISFTVLAISGLHKRYNYYSFSECKLGAFYSSNCLKVGLTLLGTT